MYFGFGFDTLLVIRAPEIDLMRFKLHTCILDLDLILCWSCMSEKMVMSPHSVGILKYSLIFDNDES